MVSFASKTVSVLDVNFDHVTRLTVDKIRDVTKIYLLGSNTM